jgi:hypothetical protein
LERRPEARIARGRSTALAAFTSEPKERAFSGIGTLAALG